MQPIRMVIADDHPMTLMGLDILFGGQPDFSVLATLSDGQDVFNSVKQLRPDVLLLDVNLPNRNGFEVLKQLKDDGIECKTALYTYQIDDHRWLEAMKWGVRGVVLKTLPPEKLLQAIRKIHLGEQWLEIVSVGKALQDNAVLQSATEILTDRELELAQAVAKGMRNQAIADYFQIQEGTVRIHLHNVYKKLGINSRSELVAYARQQGWA